MDNHNGLTEDDKQIRELLRQTPVAPIPTDLLASCIKKPRVRLVNVPAGQPDLSRYAYLDKDEAFQGVVRALVKQVPGIEFPDEKQTRRRDAAEVHPHSADLPLPARIIMTEMHKVKRVTPVLRNPVEYAEPVRANDVVKEEDVPMEEVLGELRPMPEPQGLQSRVSRELLNFVAGPSPRLLAALNRALAAYLKDEGINPTLAVPAVVPLLEFLRAEAPTALCACEILMRLRLKSPDHPQLNTVEIATSMTSNYRRVMLDCPMIPSLLISLDSLSKLWNELVAHDCVDDQQAISLFFAALEFVTNRVPNFPSEQPDEEHGTAQKSSRETIEPLYNATSRALAKLMVTCYRHFPELRPEFMNDVVNRAPQMILHPRTFPLSRAPGAPNIFILSAVLLEFVHITGGISTKKWQEACAFSTRQLIEKESIVCANNVTRICTSLSEEMIVMARSARKLDPARKAVITLIEDIAAALGYPEWPGAELFVTSFVESLFQQEKENAEHAYSTFVFDALRLLQPALWNIYKHRASTEQKISVGALDITVGSVLDYLQSIGKTDAAAYLATRQCTRASQRVSADDKNNPPIPYKDFGTRLSSDLARLPPVPSPQCWHEILSQWPLSTFYEQILVYLLNLTQRNDVSDAVQVSLLKVLAPCVKLNAEYFFKVSDLLLSRLRDATPAVCEAILSVAVHYMATVEVDECYEIICRVVQRIAGPGASNYKKRCLKLLHEIHSQSSLQNMRSLCVKNIVLATSDKDVAVSNLAQDLLTKTFLPEDASPRNVDVLADTLLAVNASVMPIPQLLRSCLRRILISVNHTKRTVIQRVVSALLDNVAGNKNCDDSLSTAAILIEANGRLLPISYVNYLFAIAVSRGMPPSRRCTCLSILNSAFCMEPPIMINSKLSQKHFATVLAMVRYYREDEFDFAGPILWQLASMGSGGLQLAQKKKLLTVAEQALLGLIKHGTATSLDLSLDEALKLKQLCLISGCVRFWPPPREWRAMQEADDFEVKKEAIRCHERLCMTADCFLEVLEKLRPGSSERILVVQTLSKIGKNYPELLFRSNIDNFFSRLSETNQLAEWNEFMKQLFEYLCDEDEEVEMRALASEDQIHAEQVSMSQKELHSESSEIAADSAAAGLLQRYLDPILLRAMAEEDDLASVAVKLLSKSLEGGRVDVYRCVPAVIALTTATSQEISQPAKACLIKIHDQWKNAVAPRLVDGLKLAAVLRERIDGSVADADHVSFVWSVLTGGYGAGNLCRASRSSLKAAVERLVASLKQFNASYAILIASGICRTPLDPRDALSICNGLEDILLSCDYTDQTHDANDVATIIVYFTLRLFLRRKYNLDQLGEEDALEIPVFSDIVVRSTKDIGAARKLLCELQSQADCYGPHIMTIISSSSSSSQENKRIRVQ